LSLYKEATIPPPAKADTAKTDVLTKERRSGDSAASEPVEARILSSLDCGWVIIAPPYLVEKTGFFGVNHSENADLLIDNEFWKGFRNTENQDSWNFSGKKGKQEVSR
jgi:hypothetical protein